MKFQHHALSIISAALILMSAFELMAGQGHGKLIKVGSDDGTKALSPQVIRASFNNQWASKLLLEEAQKPSANLTQVKEEYIRLYNIYEESHRNLSQRASTDEEFKIFEHRLEAVKLILIQHGIELN